MTSRFTRRTLLFVVAVALVRASAAAQVVGASPLVPIHDMEPLPVLQRAKDVGPANPGETLVIAVSLPIAQPEAMQAFVDDVSNPSSPNYRQFISPDDVGARFGVPLAAIQQVADYLGQHGLTVTEVARNRLAVVARGTVAQAEQAFHTTLRAYTATPEHENEPAEFIAPATAVRLPAELAARVIDVSGLDTFTRPRALKQKLTPFLSRALYNAQPIFDDGLTGAGRTVGISNFDGFKASNWPLFINQYTLPTPAGGPASNITVVPVSGGGAGATNPSGEGDLDIQMALGAAPLANIRIYDSPKASNLIAVLTAEANDNECDAISESYGWQLPVTTATSAHNLHLSMSAEGITYMAASGDFGTTIEPFSYPDYDPEVLSVGGTVANVDPVTGIRITEKNWTGGGGGWSTKNLAFNKRPSWQVGTGVPPITASTDKRLVPDVAFHSSGSTGGAYEFFLNGGLTSAVGTSFASPVFVGHLQLVSQQVISLGGLAPDANGKRRFGRIQDLIYAQNGDPAIWFDITTGNTNGPLPSGEGTSFPGVGWDTCVGWGPMDCQAFAAAVVCETGGCSGPWTNLGSGLAGISGIPGLVASGTLVPNSPASLALTSAKPLTLAILFLSFTSTPTPFKGGIVLAAPALTTTNFATDSSGAITLGFTWPPGAPAGTSVYFQYAVQDAVGPKGASLSNCEKGLTP